MPEVGNSSCKTLGERLSRKGVSRKPFQEKRFQKQRLDQAESRTLEKVFAVDHHDLYDYHDQLWKGVDMDSQIWTVAEAKAKFSEVLERANSSGPQTITRNGRTAAVVVAADEWERKTKRAGNLADFFAASPLPGSGLKLSRSRELPRKPRL